jgi:hypothetical protein
MNLLRGLKTISAIGLMLALGLSVTLHADTDPQPDIRRQIQIEPDGLAHLRNALRFWGYKICLVSDIGLARCLTSQRYANFNRLVLTPEQARRINALFDDFAHEHGIDSPGDILAECHGQWRSIDVRTIQSKVPARPVARIELSAVLSSAEQSAIVASCANGMPAGDVHVADHGRPEHDSEHRRLVDSTVNKMDLGFTNCRDSETSPVAQQSDLDGADIRWERLDENREKAYVREHGVPVEKIPRTEIPNPFGRHWDPNSHTETEIVLTLAFVKGLEALGNWLEEQNRQSEAEEMDKLQAEQAAAAAANAKKEAEKEQERKEQEAEGRASEEEEKEAQQCLESTQCVDSAAPTASYPSPDGIGSSCAERIARWQRFKEYCEHSDWREFRCDQFIRRVNGCVDITQIRPGPDGDATCRARLTEEEQRRYAAEHNCQKRGMIAIPDDSGRILCHTDLDAMRLPTMNICNDPHARPSEDQCFDGRTAVPERQRGHQSNPQR